MAKYTTAQKTENVSNPWIERIDLVGSLSIEVPAGSIVFVVGPNNGGKSTFLNEIPLGLMEHASGPKWISAIHLNIGSEEEWSRFTDQFFQIDPTDTRFLTYLSTGNRIGKHEIERFPANKKISDPSFLVRDLDAQGRISLADQTSAPDVLRKARTHPYHTFYYENSSELLFSKKVKSAFGKDFRVNRTGNLVVGNLGKSPKGDRLSVEYETEILTSMTPVSQFGDGVRSYTGILLNAIADARPITIIDEPEAFLHPPQARRLGHEMASAAQEHQRQVFVATHSSDFIQGALSAKNPNTIFIYLNHSNARRKAHIVGRDVVEGFSKKPFLSHTNALDALFYNQVVLCEGEADIMFFKWALDGTYVGKKLQESFWLSSYGKAAIPGMMEEYRRLGVLSKAIFDLDVLLSVDIIEKMCAIVGVNFDKYKGLLNEIASSIKVPPAAEALQKIEKIISAINETEDSEPSRADAVRAIKKSAEGLGKSWVLKSSGLTCLPRGQTYSRTVEFIELMRSKGVVILEEGEIENYAPEVGKHGQTWVRKTIEAGMLGLPMKTSIERQLSQAL